MGLGNLRKRRAAGQSGNYRLTIRLQLETLERRDLLAVYLPDTFADGKAQPIGVAFNGGEQAFFAGYSGNLRFEFGQSAAGYATSPQTDHDLVLAGATPTWNARTLNDLLAAAADAPVGNLETYQTPSVSGGETQLHVVYRAAGGKLVDVGSSASSWESHDIVASGAVSDPETATFNGGRQILYIDSAGRVHFVASADGGSTWNDTDLTALVGQDTDATAKAVPTSGIAAIQVGSYEYYAYHRADGALGYFLWSGTAWGYDVLDSTDLPGFIAPFNGATGAMESLSYSTSGASNPNVGWFMFKDGAGDVRGVWLTEGGTWHSARLTNIRTGSAVAASYDPANHRVNIAYYDANSHLHLLTEGAPWNNQDYHAGAVLTMPLGNLGEADTPATPSTGTATFADGSSVTVTAPLGGTYYDGVQIAVAATVGVHNHVHARYNPDSKVIILQIRDSVTKEQIAAAINEDTDFHAVVGGSGVGFDPIVDGDYGTFGTFSGATDVIPGTAARPDIYFRDFASNGSSASLQILYKDMSGHVHNVRPTATANPVVFDTTAYLEGYRSTFGYGLVNAARAVAYALGTQTVVTGAPLENWNLDLVKAPDAWSNATGANTAVFALDSGVDMDNLDLNTLAGRNVVAQTTNVADTTGHGTGVAGIIAAKNDAAGITGVAFDAKVVPIKVGDGSPSSETVLVNGIDYAMNYTLPGGYASATRVINLSLATTQTSSPGNVLAALRNKMYAESPDAVFVLAAGNRTQSRPDYPASFAVGFGIVAGAINIDGKRWSPTNGTSTLTPLNYLLAPGVAVPTDALVGDSGDNHNQADATGTSISAAHVSGVIALMLDANPALTPRQVESILIASADQVITQTVAASAPAIPGTIYFAGESDGGQMPAPLTSTTRLAVESDPTTNPNAIPASPANEQQIRTTVVATAATQAVDEVFEAVSQEEAEDLLDLFAAGDSLEIDR